MSYRNGWDVCFARPNELKEYQCKICGTMCEVSKNVNGPTCFASAMAGHSSLHDKFYCPHSEQEWHEKAGELLDECVRTHSKRVAQLIMMDLDELLAEHNKKCPKWDED